MTYAEVVESARKNLKGYCAVCPVCNGTACRGKVPGPGGKGMGDSFTRSFEKLREIKINMDMLYKEEEIDMSIEMFGRTFKAPFFAAPIGGVDQHYGNMHSDESFAKALVPACEKAGIAAFTGDGKKEEYFVGPLATVTAAGGCGVPTVKPWPVSEMIRKAKLAENAGAMAVASDIDAAGLIMLKNGPTPAGPKSVEEMREIISSVKIPFVIKGIMTVESAKKALEAGAYGIVVSNHGGRVLDQMPAACEVLPDIVKAVGDKMKIFTDGAVRSGNDVFKLLALGADAVLIGRPYVTAVYGAGEEGAYVYTQKIMGELRETMMMTGCTKIADIDRSKIRI